MKLINYLSIGLLILTQPIWAAIGSNAIAEVRSGGNSNNGAFFNIRNTNMISNWATDTNTANTTAPVISSVSYNFTASDDEQWLFIKSGTNWYANAYTNGGCWYQIDSVASNKATLRADVGQGYCIDFTKGYPEPAFIPTTVVGVSASATVTGGTGTVDYTQSDTSYANGTDLASTDATTTCTVSSATYTFRNVDVGGSVRISAGSSWLTGWYEIVSVSGGNAVLDRPCGSVASITGGTFRVHGAFAFGSNDDAFMDSFPATAGVGGSILSIRSGTHVPTGVIGVSGSGAAQNPISFIGYTSIRGDSTTGSNRPLLTFGANSIAIPSNWNLANLIITGTAANLVRSSTSTNSKKFFNVKIINNSNTATRYAITEDNAAGPNLYLNVELASYRGVALNSPNSNQNSSILNSYIHSSATCAIMTGYGNFINNLVIGCSTAGLNHGGTSQKLVIGNTFINGVSTLTGTAVTLSAADQQTLLMNNIVYGWSVGFAHGTSTQTAAATYYNNIYNTTTPYSNVGYGTTDLNLDPGFTSIGEVNGSTGAFTAGNDRLVDTSKNFTSLGVVAGRDTVYISGGTGSTAMFYGVSSITTTTNPNDTLVLDTAPGTNTTADKTYVIITGRNACPGNNMKGAGFGGYQGGYTTSSVDIGACQRTESAGGGGTRTY